MRLINVKVVLKSAGAAESAKFESPLEDDVHGLEYAILSHRWFKKELTLSEISQKSLSWWQRDPVYRASADKLLDACRTTKYTYGLDYLWADTCCIDKTSSAELAESLRSMFDWYHNATICIAYLADVDALENLGSSEWFKRSWTLQEFLASQALTFFSSNWSKSGSRQNFATQISAATGIPKECQSDFINKRNEISLAARLSWAAQRQATRVEDRVYSLFGILDAYTTPAYGEGLTKAFMNLQLEIIKKSKDESIFAWKFQTPESLNTLESSSTPKSLPSYGLLAPNPSYFKDAGDIELKPVRRSRTNYTFLNGNIVFPIPQGYLGSKSDPNPITNGISRAFNRAANTSTNGIQISLYCWDKNEGWNNIRLRLNDDGRWERTKCDELEYTRNIVWPKTKIDRFAYWNFKQIASSIDIPQPGL